MPPARVALIRCQSYEPALVAKVLRRQIDLLGGIDTFVRSDLYGDQRLRGYAACESRPNPLSKLRARLGRQSPPAADRSARRHRHIRQIGFVWRSTTEGLCRLRESP